MPERIAIDAGHGFTKALAGDAQMIFPSLICPAPATLDLGEFGATKPIQIDGRPYLVGEAARKHATPLWSRDKATDPDTLRLILVAAAQLGASGPIALATGLPLSWYGAQRRAFREALTGYGGHVQRSNQPPQRLWFESVIVLPQGLAAAVPVLAHGEHESGAYLIADVGYRTTDYLIVEKAAAGRIQYDAERAGSLPIGTGAITKTIVDAINQQYQVEYAAGEMENRPTVTVRGQSIDLTQRRREGQRAVAHQIVHALAHALGSEIDKLTGIVAVGGGSVLIAEVLPGILIPADPQWANAQGYWNALS